MSKFKCKCLDGSYKSIIASPKTSSQDDARISINCTPVVDEYMKGLESASNLIDFLAVNKVELKNVISMDEGEEPNICNPLRIVNIATLYLAHHLGLSVDSVRNNYAWDSSKAHVFPNHTTQGPEQIFIPADLADFPNLEQAYWTILSQYTSYSEPYLRRGKDRMWCVYYGIAVMDHCVKMVTQADCSLLKKANIRRDHCRMVWRNFTEVCHRVRSLNTTAWEYKIQSTERFWCLPKSYLDSGLSLYVLYRR